MLNRLVLGAAAVLAVVAQAQANPIIENMFVTPGVGFSLAHTDGSPAPELVRSLTITERPFSSVTSSGGGSAFAGSPSIQGSDTSARIVGQPFALTVAGAGSATAAFGARITATFTNTGQTDENYNVNNGYCVCTFVQADWPIGETLAYSWSIGTTWFFNGSPFPITISRSESQSHVCNQTDHLSNACFNFYDNNFYLDPYPLAAGQSATFFLTMDFNLAATAAPEPSGLGVIAAGLLALGLLGGAVRRH